MLNLNRSLQEKENDQFKNVNVIILKKIRSINLGNYLERFFYKNGSTLGKNKWQNPIG